MVAYDDHATAHMPEARRMRITRIEHSPRITVVGDVDDDRVRRMLDIAHGQCFIANTLQVDTAIDPTVVHALAGRRPERGVGHTAGGERAGMPARRDGVGQP